MADYQIQPTVGDLIEALSKFPKGALVGALTPSSMTTGPLYIFVNGAGVVELVGDETARYGEAR